MDINKPRFELTSVYNDGTAEEPQIVPINEMPFDTNTNRRGFLGAGLVAGAALILLTKCSPPKKSASKNIPAKSPGTNRNKKGITLYAHCDAVKAITISPDGKILVSASADRTLKFWSLPDGHLLKKFKPKTSRYNIQVAANALAISPNGKILASAQDNYIKLWSLPNGDSLKKLKGHSSTVEALCISPDGKILASGAYDNTIKLWSFPKGNLLNTLKGHSKEVNLLSISPDGKILLSRSADTSIKLWSLPDGNLLKTLEGNNTLFNTFLISPDNKVLATALADKTIKLWSLPDGNLIKTLEGHSTRICTLAISPDGRILVSGSWDKTIKLWSFPDGNLIKTLEDHSESIESLSISPDGKILASTSGNKTKLWSFPEGNLLKSFEEQFLSAKLLISQDGKMLVSSGLLNGTICLYDLEKNEFTGFLFDPVCNETDGITYNAYDKVTGITRTYTLPCGSAIPPGAVCTCNCVAGTYTRPAYSPSSSGGSYCTCNQVCTCVPVCQAHKLLDPDKFIRILSRQILLFMGVNELEYMNWAADNSKAKLESAIQSVINDIKEGIGPDLQNWPAIKECEQYLHHDDEVVSVMAAQMINLQSNLKKQPITGDTHQKIESLLIKSEEMHWKKKISTSGIQTNRPFPSDNISVIMSI